MAHSSSAQALLSSLPSRTGVLAHAEVQSIAVERVVADRRVPFIDANLYDLPDTCAAEKEHFRKDMMHILALRDVLLHAEKFLSLVYGYRACARALPQLPPTADEKTKTEFSKNVFELIRPEIVKMKQLMTFCDTAVLALVNVIGQLVPIYKNQQTASEELLHHMIRTIDVFLVLDALKNMKSSLNNDFSMMYKRAIAVVTREGLLQEDETAENHKLYLFLANHDRFSFKLKEELAKLPVGYDEVFIDIINLCVDYYDKCLYVMPDDKHTLLKTAAFSLSLIDQPGDEKDVHKKKRLKLERLSRIIKAMPVVPLFGDMTITLSNLLLKTPHLDGKWDVVKSEEPMITLGYSVLEQIESYRHEYITYLTQLQLVLDTVQMSAEPGRKQETMDDKNQKCYQILLVGLQLLSKLSAAILEQNAWKFARPTDHHRNSDCPETALNYEKAILYNYDADERFALVEFITMIKTLASYLHKAEARLEQYARAHVYAQLQAFARGPVDAMLMHTTKKKRSVAGILKHVYEIMADFVDDKSSVSMSPTGVNKRVVVPTPTQLYYVRSLLQSISSERAAGMKGGFMKEKDLKDTHVQDINNFVDGAFFYPFILDFATCVMKCSDLSDLWYKEFYLELNKQIQFPIEMSLPWILTNHMLRLPTADLTEDMLFPLSIYNDAACHAIYDLKLKYIYDEIEAEANLAVDMFVTKYAERIIRYYKVLASSHLLSEYYKHNLQSGAVSLDKKLDAPLDKHRVIIKQRNIQMLGRTIDLHKLLTEHINYHMRRSIETAIAKYEASDITGIMELQSLFDVLRQTHRLLSQELDIDELDDMIAEVNESHYHNTNGRIYSHTVQELCGDFLAQFAYNHLTQRFVRSAAPLVESVQRQSAPRVKHHYLYGTKYHLTAHNSYLQQYEHFVGDVHFHAIVNLLGTSRVYMLVSEVIDTADNLIKEGVTPYTWALSEGFPPTLKLPGVGYGIKGTFEYFQALLKPLLAYKDLAQVFEIYRELGNAVIVLQKLERVLILCYVLNPLQKLPRKSTGTDLETKLWSLCQMKPAPVHVHLLRETARPSVMPAALQRLYATIIKVHPLWMNNESNKGVPEDQYAYECSREFYRTFSFLQFAYCLPTEDANGVRHREVFGDSIHWAGYLVLSALSQTELFCTFDFTWHVCYVGSLGLDKEKKEKITPATQKTAEELTRFINLGDFYRAMCRGVQQYFENIQNCIVDISSSTLSTSASQ